MRPAASRIAAGSGTSIPEVNRVVKMQKQMGLMMKKMGKMGEIRAGCRPCRPA